MSWMRGSRAAWRSFKAGIANAAHDDHQRHDRDRHAAPPPHRDDDRDDGDQHRRNAAVHRPAQDQERPLEADEMGP
jgi:hypothetical protein